MTLLSVEAREGGREEHIATRGDKGGHSEWDKEGVRETTTEKDRV